jgi:hypothetical protein
LPGNLAMTPCCKPTATSPFPAQQAIRPAGFTQENFMTLSMYQASAPVLTRALHNLAAILKKAEAHAAEHKIDPDTLLSARLAPDMHPLTRQVQMVSDSAKGGIARLAGIDVPSFPDTETSFAELQDRITKTIAFIDGVKASQVDGSEALSITLKFPRGEMHFTGQNFLLQFCLPNVFFHVTTAYAVLRHAGIPLGKLDYLGSP